KDEKKKKKQKYNHTYTTKKILDSESESEEEERDEKKKKKQKYNHKTGEGSSTVMNIEPPTGWDGKSLPDKAFKLFITKNIRLFNIGPMRLTIIKYSEKNVRYRIGTRGG
ncbi:MAG: hypothetical protein V7K47_13210, partial [Nostoc sp.]